MKKIIKILIILICICLFINFTLSRYIAQNSDISRIIGNLYTGGTISTVNYARISNNFEYYIESLKNKEYEKTYEMLLYSYKLYKSYDEFCDEQEKINYTNIVIKNIIKRAENLYSIITENEGVENEFLIIFNSQNTAFVIVPEPFLEYKLINEELKNKNVKYKIIESTNYVEKFVLNIEITNLNNKETVYISDLKLLKESGKKIGGNINFPLEIKPKEEKNIIIEFETYIDFPTEIEISRIKKNNVTETYTMNIQK